MLLYKNFYSVLQLLEEEMAWECGGGQPFIDPGFQAYEAFDYKKPQDNGPGWSCRSCRPHSWGQAAQGGGTRGGEQGEAEANSGMISCLTMSRSRPSPLLSSPTISGTRICVR